MPEEVVTRQVTQQAIDRKALLKALAEAGGKLTAEEDVIFEGTRIILPVNMDLGNAIGFLKEKLQEDEREVSFTKTYNFRPWDGARATLRAFKKVFGMATQRSTINMWGEEEPPEMITINVAVDETEQVPWGAMAVPLLRGVEFHLGMTRHKEHGMLFVINAQGPRKWRFHIEGLFRAIEDELKTESLYRGKAFDGQQNPDFLDLSMVDPEKVVYSNEVTTQLEANVWALIRHTDKMKENGVPLKRAVLLEGPYGTGKTLGAYLTAQVAQKYGWTFIYCRPAKDNLIDVVATARLYQPACVFFEDIDNVAGSEDHVTKLLDIFDGIQAKGTEIICVLTTNNVQTIHKGMVRPGRLDAVIHIGELDRQGIERLAKVTLPEDLLDPGIDWDKVADAMPGLLPAFAREAFDRALRYNMARNDGNPTMLSTDDICNAAYGLHDQLDLMNGANDTPKQDRFAEVFKAEVRDALSDGTLVLDDDGTITIKAEKKDAIDR